MIEIFQTTATGGVAPGVQLPQRTLFVSPNFTDVSPFFSTIPNAMAAADGINPTLIIVYPGAYNLLATLAIKHNTFIYGTDRTAVTVDHGGIGIFFQATVAAGTFNFGIANLKISSAIQGVGIDIQVNGGTMVAVIQNVDIVLMAGSSTGINHNNATATTAHRLAVVGCGISVNGTNGGINLNKPIPDHTVDRCSIINAAGPTIYAAFQAAGFNTFNVTNSTIGAIRTVTGGVVGIYNLRNCIVIAPTIPPTGSGELLRFYSCHVVGQALDIGSSGTGIYDYHGCTFEGLNGVDTVFININRTDPTVRLYNCSLHNGHINFAAANANKCVFIDTVVKNPTGTRSISTTSTPTVFVGNFTSNQILDAAVVQAAGSFNVQVGVAI